MFAVHGRTSTVLVFSQRVQHDLTFLVNRGFNELVFKRQPRFGSGGLKNSVARCIKMSFDYAN